jgi:hypothetical protein
MTLKIYPASSWRNATHPDVVCTLRADGHAVYDFHEGNNGFRWPPCSTLREYIRQLESDPLVAAAFRRDKEALDWCDVCVLILPCGRSAHLEAAYASGLGKPVIVVLSEAESLEPELMYKLLAVGAGRVRYVTSTAELCATLRNATDNKTDDLAALGEVLARDEIAKVNRLIEAGYSDLADKVLDNEIDIGAAMQVFDGRRP